MREAFIVEAVRIPLGRGRQGGALESVHPVDLLGLTLAGVVKRVAG